MDDITEDVTGVVTVGMAVGVTADYSRRDDN